MNTSCFPLLYFLSICFRLIRLIYDVRARTHRAGISFFAIFYSSNVAKQEYNEISVRSIHIDDRRPTDLRANSHILGKFQMAISQRRVIRSTSCLVLGGVFGNGGSNGAISGWIKSKMSAGRHLRKLQTAISQQRIIRFTVCMYADHTLPSVSNL